jgi:hypothetical protein
MLRSACEAFVLFIIISDLILVKKKMITLFPEVSNQKREKKFIPDFLTRSNFSKIVFISDIMNGIH